MLAAQCGGQDPIGAGPGGSPSAAEFCRGLAEANCATMAACCSNASADIASACRTVLSAQCTDAQPVYRGYDSGAAAQCLEQARNAPPVCAEPRGSESLDRRMERLCPAAFPGKVPLGKTCSTDEDCASTPASPAYCFVAYDTPYGFTCRAGTARSCATDPTLCPSLQPYDATSALCSTLALLAAPTTSFSSVDGPVAMAVDETHLYWSDSKEIRRARKSGGGVESVLSPANVPTTMPGNTTFLESILVDGGLLYWSDGFQVGRVAKTGGMPEVIAFPRAFGLRRLAVDGSGIWVGDPGCARLTRITRAWTLDAAFTGDNAKGYETRLLAHGDRVYCANEEGRIVVVDESTRALVTFANVDGPITAMAGDGERIWVATNDQPYDDAHSALWSITIESRQSTLVTTPFPRALSMTFDSPRMRLYWSSDFGTWSASTVSPRPEIVARSASGKSSPLVADDHFLYTAVGTGLFYENDGFIAIPKP